MRERIAARQVEKFAKGQPIRVQNIYLCKVATISAPVETETAYSCQLPHLLPRLALSIDHLGSGHLRELHQFSSQIIVENKDPESFRRFENKDPKPYY